MITIENLDVKMKKKHILKNISLNINRSNKIIGLFGPNGSGKTTLINTLVGNIQRFKGSIKKDTELQISYLPDKSFLYSFMTIKQAIDFFDNAFSDFDSIKAIRLLGDLSLDSKIKISECSKGMLEQIHLILILSRKVPFYIFDEPLAAVDPLTRDFLVELIRNEREPNSVLLLSTHLIADVESLFDEVIIINNGEIVEQAIVKELVNNNKTSLEELVKERLR